MCLAVTLVVWIGLAAIGVASAGFWGFLGVAVLYVLYYALLRPRVTVHVTPQDLADDAAARAGFNAITLDTLSKSMKRAADDMSAPTTPRRTTWTGRPRS
jgi:hypothetical protein